LTGRYSDFGERFQRCCALGCGKPLDHSSGSFQPWKAKEIAKALSNAGICRAKDTFYSYRLGRRRPSRQLLPTLLEIFKVNRGQYFTSSYKREVAKKAFDQQEQAYAALKAYKYDASRGRQVQADVADDSKSLAHHTMEAISRACNDGLYQRGYEIYLSELGGNRYSGVSLREKLSLTRENLDILSTFFLPGRRWFELGERLDNEAKSFILSEVGACLQALGRLNEADKPMKAALGIAIAAKDWRSAAKAAFELTLLNRRLGYLVEAQHHAESGTEFAARCQNKQYQMLNLASLAATLHQLGEFKRAQQEFIAAEHIQHVYMPQDTIGILCNVSGYGYCDFLLDLSHSNWSEVLSRVKRTLALAERQNWRLIVGWEHISLGRAQLIKAQGERRTGRSAGLEHLNQAVRLLAEAGHRDSEPMGLLARAELRRLTAERKSFEDECEADLTRALSIAERHNLRLHELDARLGLAQLALDRRQTKQARNEFARCRVLLEKTRYFRRRPKLLALETELNSAS
jgi:hypothetical protein